MQTGERKKGGLPAFKVGKNWRFSRAALMKWAQQDHVRERKAIIAVVDDDTRTTFTLSEILKTNGYKVVVEKRWQASGGLIDEE